MQDTSFTRKALAIGFGLSICLSPTTALATSSQSAVIVRRVADRLSVNLADALVVDAVAALESEAAIRVKGLTASTERVSLAFANERVEVGIERILRALAADDYALVRKPDDRGSIDVVILDGGRALIAQPPAARSAKPKTQTALGVHGAADADLMGRVISLLGNERVVGSVDETRLESD